ncbi:MAG: hypothetical protein RR696_00390 [Clostridia bacterium]
MCRVAWGHRSSNQWASSMAAVGMRAAGRVADRAAAADRVAGKAADTAVAAGRVLDTAAAV